MERPCTKQSPNASSFDVFEGAQFLGITQPPIRLNLLSDPDRNSVFYWCGRLVDSKNFHQELVACIKKLDLLDVIADYLVLDTQSEALP